MCCGDSAISRAVLCTLHSGLLLAKFCHCSVDRLLFPKTMGMGHTPLCCFFGMAPSTSETHEVPRRYILLPRRRAQTAPLPRFTPPALCCHPCAAWLDCWTLLRDKPGGHRLHAGRPAPLHSRRTQPLVWAHLRRLSRPAACAGRHSVWLTPCGCSWGTTRTAMRSMPAGTARCTWRLPARSEVRATRAAC